MRVRLFSAVLGAVAVFMPALASAQTLKLPACATGRGDCSTCDLFGLVVAVIHLGFQVLSLIVLLMFVVGGFLMIASPAYPKLVDKGKAMITGAVIGTIFAFGGYFIVNVIIGSFLSGKRTAGDFAKLELFKGQGSSSARHWAEYCKGGESGADTGGENVSSQCNVETVDQPCTTGTCTENCLCASNNQCLPECEVIHAEEGNTARCVADASACATGTVDNGAVGSCPSATPVCCIIQSGN